MKHLAIFLACAAGLAGCVADAPTAANFADAPTAATFADLAVPEKRLAAQQAILDHSRTFPNASPEAKAWFERVRTAAKSVESPEAQAALQQVLMFDPSSKPRLPLNPKQPSTYEDPEGTTPETKLAHLERLLDLRRSAKEYPLTVEELVALSKHDDFATAQRANRLLRRISYSAAAPILWERLAKLSQRSQVQEVEDEILRLPSTQAAKYLPAEFTGTTLASKAAWIRVVAVRANRLSKNGKALRSALLPMLKGPANELTEAAWAAVPRLFVEADRAALTEAAQGLSERLAPKAKAALDALPAR
jgi:hypothetical protein